MLGRENPIPVHTPAKASCTFPAKKRADVSKRTHSWSSPSANICTKFGAHLSAVAHGHSSVGEENHKKAFRRATSFLTASTTLFIPRRIHSANMSIRFLHHCIAPSINGPKIFSNHVVILFPKSCTDAAISSQFLWTISTTSDSPPVIKATIVRHNTLTI